ncbi:metal-dependent hydrolase [Megalodesulfovibrio paquesii]
MPGYKLHLAFGGVVIGGGLAAAHHHNLATFDPFTATMLMLIGLGASIFPDVDTNSKGQHLFYALLAVVDMVLMAQERYKWSAILGFIAMLPAISRHRGFTHRWWAALLIPALVCALPLWFYQLPWQAVLPGYLAAVLGYLSHLVLDAVA